MPWQHVLALPHRPAVAADDFIVSSSNRESIAWIDRWPAWRAPMIIVHGPPKTGKSHLLAVWRARSLAQDVDIATLDRDRLPSVMSSANAYALDDIDRAFGDRTRERCLFHFFNMLNEEGGFAVATSRLAMSAYTIGLPDLASRLRAVPSVSLAPPDDALLEWVFVKTMADRRVPVDPNVVRYVLARIDRSLEAVHLIAEQLDRYSLSLKRRVTIPMAKRVLSMESTIKG